MTEQTPSEIERDAERVRAQIADTAEHLKNKMSPGQLMDEVVTYFKDGDANQFVDNLKKQVRDNPLALALVGSGLAWLMMGSGPTTGGSVSPGSNALAGHGSSARPLAGSNTYGGEAKSRSASSHGAPGIGASIGKGVAGAKSSAGATADMLSDSASSASAAASATLHDIRDGASHAVHSGADLGVRAKNGLLDALEREPLVLGALGVAVGAAIGAMIPVTRAEREYLGAASAEARQTAEAALGAGVKKAKHVAQDVYAAARDEADRQGLTPSEKPLAARVASVGKAAGSELRSAADQSIDKAETSADETMRGYSSDVKPSR